MSRVTAIISALVICIIVCLSWAVNHYRDNAIAYKEQRDKKVSELKQATATGELQHRNSLSAQLNMKCHEFDQKKDMASFCGQGLAAWRYTKPVLVAEINSLANQLQITIPGLSGICRYEITGRRGRY
ncbi:hypothetical protein ACF0JY_004568 [Escherichia coli]